MPYQIRQAAPGDMSALRRLWDLGFPGEDAAGSFFFSRLYPRAHTLLAADGDDRPVAMLHMLPYSFLWRGRLWDLFYIYGVATHPAHQNKGLAGRLVDQALFTAHLRSVLFAALIVQKPSLADYYARFGFVPCTPEPVFTLSDTSWTRMEEDPVPRLNELYETHLRTVAHPLRDERLWRDILSDMAPQGGQPFLLNSGGYALMTPSGGRIWEAFGPGSACRFTDQPMACLRIVEAKPLIAHAKDTGLALPPFSLVDDYAPWNNSPDDPPCEPVWSAAGLTQALLIQNETPYFNLMYN